MPSTYSSNLKIELMSTGENSGTWGNITNTNLGTALEQAIVGYGAVSYASDANLTISITNSNAAQAARALVLNVTSAVSLTATRELVVPTSEKQYIVQNNTTGSQSITVKTSAGTGITVPNGRKAHLYVDGTNVIQMFDFVDINGGTIDGTAIGGSSAAAGAFTTLNASGATTLDGNVTLGNASGDNVTVTGTITSHLLFTDNTYDIGANGATRPRNLFLAGAATIGGNLSVGGTLTLTGGLILNGNVTVGDSSADTLTVNATITSNLLFTDNTYDIGASGATRPRNLFLAGNATVGGNQTLTGSLTVDSTTDSSSTTTGSIQTDGGLGVAKALYVGTTANIAGNVTLSGGTANGVAYLNGSKVLTTGSALTFDGTNFATTGSGTLKNLLLSGGTLPGAGNPSIALRSSDNVIYHQSGSANTIVMLDSAQNTMQSIGATAQIWNISNAEQMRLTSTGLGIGTSSPDQALVVNRASGSTYLKVSGANNANLDLALFFTDGTNNAYFGMMRGTSGGVAGALHSYTGGAIRSTLDSSGNLGLGVTPSAWGSAWKAFDESAVGSLAATPAGSGDYGPVFNAYNDNTNWRYKYTGGAAMRYRLNESGHAWFTAPSGTAGNAISFTQAMTLDASGNLQLGATSGSGNRLNVVGTGGIRVNEDGAGTKILTIRSDYAGVDPAINVTTNNSLLLMTNNTERARITSGGDFGIGTSSPGSKLSVTSVSSTAYDSSNTLVSGSTARLSNTDTSSSVAATLLFEATGGGGGNGLATISGVNTATGSCALTFGTRNSSGSVTERGRFDSTGRFLVGTTSNFGGAGQFAIDQSGGGIPAIHLIGTQGVGGGGREIGATFSVVTNDTGPAYGNVAKISAAKENATQGNTAGYMAFQTTPNGGSLTERARIDSSGRLLIGNTTPYDNATLSVTSASQLYSVIADGGTTGNRSRGGFAHPATKVFALNVDQADGVLAFYQNGNTERGRFSSTGLFFVGVTSQQGGGAHCFQAGSGVNSLQMQNNGATPYGPYINFSAAAPNNASQYFIYCADTAATRMVLYANGGLANYQANDSNLSDRREKTNFAPAKSYLDIICAIPVQTFNYIDQNLEEDDGLTLGVVAQDVQAVAPELVMESNWGTKDEPKMRLSIYQTDLQYALMKALQELKAEFDAYKASHP